MKKSNQISVFVTQNPLIDKKYPYWMNFPASSTISDIVSQHKFLHYIPFICHVNKIAVSRKSWQSLRLKSEDKIEFTYYPLQGDVGKAVSQVALFAALTAINPAAAIGASGFFASSINLATFAAGGILIDAILPTPQLSQDDFSGFKTPSPTYSIQARSNQIRLGRIIPVQYGTHKIYPDLAAKPFSNYENNQQYLHLLFCIGLGKFDTNNAQIYIDDTPIENYNEYIETQWVNPGEDITLFDHNLQTVNEIGNFELQANNQNPEQPDKNVGWFTINPENTLVDKVEIDLTLPKGLGDFNSAHRELTVEWIAEVQKIDENENAIEDTIYNISDINPVVVEKYRISSETEWSYSDGWRDEEEREYIDSNRETLSQGISRIIYRYTQFNKFCEIKASEVNQPLRVTKSLSLQSAGRWQIRLRRNNEAQHVTNFNRYCDQTYLTGIKGRLVNANLSSNVSLLAMKIRASEVLSISSKLLVSVLIQRKLPSYQNNRWTEARATNSIAWALADVLRNEIYGADMSDDEFDLTELARLNQIWNNRGDEFNGIFDSEKTVWEALKDIARCGRTTPIHQAGKVSFCRDSRQNLATNLFSDRNIIKDSFSINYITASEKNPQNIELEYFNKQTWEIDTVSTSDNDQNESIKLRLFGCTSRAQAIREANYMSLANRYRRISISFETEKEGLRLRFGDIIQVAHELPSWGIAVGDIVDFDRNTRKFTLANDIDISPEQNTNYTIHIRSRTGETHIFDISRFTSNEVFIENSTDNFLVSGLDFSLNVELPHYVIYSDTDAKRAIVRGVFPINENRIKIEAVLDDDRVC